MMDTLFSEKGQRVASHCEGKKSLLFCEETCLAFLNQAVFQWYHKPEGQVSTYFRRVTIMNVTYSSLVWRSMPNSYQSGIIRPMDDCRRGPC